MSYYTTPKHYQQPPPPPTPPRTRKTGLGDVVEMVARRTGIKRIVDWRSRKTGKPCGCQKRKQQLNNLTDKVLRR